MFMSSSYNIPQEFYQDALSIIKLRANIDRKGTDPKLHPDYLKYSVRIVSLYEFLKNNPATSKVASYSDLTSFFENLPHYCKESYEQITLPDLKSSFNKFFLTVPNFYDFYFKIGQSNEDLTDYMIGNGKVFSSKRLPNKLRKYISKNKAQYLSSRDCFMYIRVNAVGIIQAKEMAFQMVSRNISIYNLVYLKSWYYDMYYNRNSQFDYFAFSDNQNPDPDHRLAEDAAHQYDSIISIERDQVRDKIILDISKIVTNDENRNELEERIFSVIDIFGLIQMSTPLKIRFMLCIMSLEALLLSGDDKDYLGWKLAEKLAFLLGNSEYWIRTYYGVGIEHLFPNHVPIPNELTHKVVENRRALNHKIRELYGKRSGFAHGSTRKNEQITEEDYSFIYAILRLSVIRVLDLIPQGFNHISKEIVMLWPYKEP